MADTLTLKGRDVNLTLFAPRRVQGGMRADAFLLSAPLKRTRTLKHENKKYRVPAGKAGFFIGRITVAEVENG